MSVHPDVNLIKLLAKGLLRDGGADGDLVASGPLGFTIAQPASLTLTLAASFQVFTDGEQVKQPVDPQSPPDNLMEAQEAADEKDGNGPCIFLTPHQFILASTVEFVTMPDDCAGLVITTSTNGRSGVQMVNAGWVDPGFAGQLTLEVFNQSLNMIRLKVGDPIANLVIFQMERRAVLPYGHPARLSRYQGQTGATAPKARR